MALIGGLGTYAERKIMAAIQRRRGPNVIGYLGLMQPIADGLKLFTKETILPNNVDLLFFVAAPMITFSLSLIGWIVIPYSDTAVISNLNLGVLYILIVSSLGVYGIFLAGWSSNSKFALIGAIRSVSQMISYELAFGFIILTVVACSNSFNLSEIVFAQESGWYCLFLFPSFLMFCVCILAETNRHPFDLAEAESELVAGYNVEYSAMGFALFFLGEYANMLFMGAIGSVLFLGGWLPIFFYFLVGEIWFSLKICCFVIYFSWIRAAIPRFRYDQLMTLGWKTFLPLSIGLFCFVSSVLLSFNLCI